MEEATRKDMLDDSIIFSDNIDNDNVAEITVTSNIIKFILFHGILCTMTV